jgi:hypothetical protein
VFHTLHGLIMDDGRSRRRRSCGKAAERVSP